MILEPMLQSQSLGPKVIQFPSFLLSTAYKSKGKICRWLPYLWAASLGLGLAMPLPAMAQGAEVLNVAQAELRPILRFGDGGAAVKELQGMLSLLGYYPNSVDGQFDNDTEVAVQTFQTDVGLTADGIVGPATWERLLPTPSTEFTPPAVVEAPAIPTTQVDPTELEPSPERSPVDLPILRVGTYGPAVTRLQTRLQALGFYRGALDGVFGAQTEDAVRAFQRNAQILDDGIVGSVTWTALLQ